MTIKDECSRTKHNAEEFIRDLDEEKNCINVTMALEDLIAINEKMESELDRLKSEVVSLKDIEKIQMDEDFGIDLYHVAEINGI